MKGHTADIVRRVLQIEHIVAVILFK